VEAKSKFVEGALLLLVVFLLANAILRLCLPQWFKAMQSTATYVTGGVWRSFSNFKIHRRIL